MQIIMQVREMTMNVYLYKSGSRKSGTNLPTKDIFPFFQPQKVNSQISMRQSFVQVLEMTLNFLPLQKGVPKHRNKFAS